MTTTVTLRHNPRVLHALEEGSIDEAQRLIEQGEDVRATNADGMTALHRAMNMVDLPVAFLNALIHAGADVNAATRDGSFPLHRAAASGNLIGILFLMKNGSALDPHDREVFGTGLTPLQTAISYGQPQALNLLIELGANVQKMGWVKRLNIEHSITALHLAASTNQPLMVQRLLDAGADHEALAGDLTGALPPCTALESARAHEALDAIPVLVAHEQGLLRQAMSDAHPAPTVRSRL